MYALPIYANKRQFNQSVQYIQYSIYEAQEIPIESLLKAGKCGINEIVKRLC